MIEDADFDFICLCCGGRNGERHPFCSYFKYVNDVEGPIDDDVYYQQLGEWLGSEEYKGSLMVPPGYILTKEYRIHLIEITESYRRSRDPGVLLFTLPGVDIPNIVSLTRFMN